MLLSLNRNALQFAKGTKQGHYLGPVVLVVVGAMLTTMGLTYGGFDLAIVGGAVVSVVGLAFLVIQYRMAKGLKA